jgi:hypothetical protein
MFKRKSKKIKKPNEKIQSILFDKIWFSSDNCTEWLNNNNYKPIKKPCIVNKYRIYRIKPANKNKEYILTYIDENMTAIVEV